LINRDLPFASYTGIEVLRPIVHWLQEHVEKHDDRFRFVHWNVQNSTYNPQAPRMQTHQNSPVARGYDVIMGFSLVTHLAPPDAAHIFRLARRAVRPEGFLFFSAFYDDAVDKFEDRVPDKPLHKAYYNRKHLEDLFGDAGWTLVSYAEPSPTLWIRSCASRGISILQVAHERFSSFNSATDLLIFAWLNAVIEGFCTISHLPSRIRTGNDEIKYS